MVVYKMWYTADCKNGWVKKNDKLMPLYDLKYLTSDDIEKWNHSAGQTVISFNNEDEHGIAKCTLWKEDNLYKIIYSIRSLSPRLSIGLC